MIAGHYEVLVDGTPYELGTLEWVRVVNYVKGDAVRYPVRVKFRTGQIGQYKLCELIETRWVEPRIADSMSTP